MHAAMCLAVLRPALEEYEFGRVLGQGAYGVVHEVVHKLTGERFAAKTISDKMPRELQKRETVNHNCLKHKHIVKVHEVIDLPESGQCVVLMEMVNGTQLFDYIVEKEQLSETEARRIFQQLIAALSYCHDQGIAHRDVKLENILIDQDLNVKVTDFGFSEKIFQGRQFTRPCGSPNYAAPELLSSKVEYRGEPVDVWAAGICLYAMLAGELPFDADDVASLFQAIKAGSYQSLDFISADAADLMKKMLSMNPTERITLQDIVQHAWFTKDLPSENPKSQEASPRGAINRCASQWLGPARSHKALITVPTWPARAV